MPGSPFPTFIEKFHEHGHEFSPPYADPLGYRQGAWDVVRRHGEGPIERCERSSDGAHIYWDHDRSDLVIVQNDEIATFFPPRNGYQYFLSQCT